VNNFDKIKIIKGRIKIGNIDVEMEYTDDAMEIIISAYLEKGIVTRNDYPNLDSRPWGRGVVQQMENRGYYEASYAEEHTDDFYDYSGVLYNPNVFSREEAMEYLKNRVLLKGLEEL